MAASRATALELVGRMRGGDVPTANEIGDCLVYSAGQRDQKLMAEVIEAFSGLRLDEVASEHSLVDEMNRRVFASISTNAEAMAEVMFCLIDSGDVGHGMGMRFPLTKWLSDMPLNWVSDVFLKLGKRVVESGKVANLDEFGFTIPQRYRERIRVVLEQNDLGVLLNYWTEETTY